MRAIHPRSVNIAGWWTIHRPANASLRQLSPAPERPGTSRGKGCAIRILLAASEVVGFAKTGGLADVAGSLPRALAKRGVEAAVVMPLYRTVATGRVPLTRTDVTLSVPVGPRTYEGRLWRATLPDSGVPVYLVEQPEFFDRDDPTHGRGLYQYSVPGGKRDYPDNGERFLFFCRAILEALPALNWWPDVLHCND